MTNPNPTTSDITAAHLLAARKAAGLNRRQFTALLAEHGYTTTIHTIRSKEHRRIHTIDVGLVVATSRALNIPATHLLGLTNGPLSRHT